MNTRVHIAGEGFFLLRERDIQREFSLTAEDVEFLTQQHAHLVEACRFFDACKLFHQQGDPASDYTQDYFIHQGAGGYHKIEPRTFEERKTRAQKLFLNRVLCHFIDAYGLPLRSREMIGAYDQLHVASSIVRIDEALDLLSRRCAGAKDFGAYATETRLKEFREKFTRRSDYWDPAEPRLVNGRVLMLRHFGSCRGLAHVLAIFESGSPRISKEFAASLPFSEYTTKGEPGTWQALPFQKVNAFRYFKNGRADLEFADSAQRMRFYCEFCRGR